MSRGIAAAAHLFGGYCCEKGRRLATEVTRADADLRTAIRKAERYPDLDVRAHIAEAKTHRDDARTRAADHEVECAEHRRLVDVQRNRADQCRDGELEAAMRWVIQEHPDVARAALDEAGAPS